jgi:cellulose synthase/poly-beta-1,6-N-acetylglucosamine synthase-like glycosyltransferase
MPSNPGLDIIVPEYNELSRQGDERFDSQLRYFSDLSERYNVILIDDASTDGSWQRMAVVAPQDRPGLHTSRMVENGHKILAVKKALEISKADYVLLTDFDSTVTTPEEISRALQKFEANSRLACVSLKLVPEGSSIYSKFQDMEYAIGRKVVGGYMVSQKKLRCVPGAAGIWKRRVLREVLREHSGRHNGDDLESTAIAIRKGYDIEYEPSVVVQTMVPQNPRDFYRQRKRWELGALETYEKERGFYLGQIKSLRSRLGHVTLLDWWAWFTTLMVPFFLANGLKNPASFAIYGSIELCITIAVSYLSRNELRSKKELMLIPVFPIYRFLATLPRLAALQEFLRRKISGDKITLQPLHINNFLIIENLSPLQIASLQTFVHRIS